ncbi:MAG: TonB-dependent receptor [Bacteroidales bacterium]|nr:TonB-dependent receptor [Bacteroidales bacterium]
MYRFLRKMKADVIRWRQFTRHRDAAFLSLRREVVICTLSVATLLSAAPKTARAQEAQQLPSDNGSREMDSGEVTVTASRVALPLAQAARTVRVMTAAEIADCPAQSVQDLLKYAASVDVRQRGIFGIQTDISINGGTHDQMVILLNGVNISSPHTGHLSADLPISPDDIERIEILEGAASRIFGASAFSGAINIVTKASSVTGDTPAGRHVSAGLAAGTAGTVGGDLRLASAGKTAGQSFSAGYVRSDGALPHSDFEKWRGFWQGSATYGETALAWQLGMSGADYGANTFYSGAWPDQYEENRRYIASVSAKTSGAVEWTPTAYAVRSLDHYQLVRGVSPWQENYHMTDVFGLSVNAETAWRLGRISAGADFRSEAILSTALGRPLQPSEYVDIRHSDRTYTRRDHRTGISYFAEHDLVLARWTVSTGVMAHLNTGLGHRLRFCPGIDLSWRPGDGRLRLFAAWNTARRMPTFTELYYHSPTQEGNVGLKPEKTSEWTMGGRWRTAAFDGSFTAFLRRQTDMIDWIVPADSVKVYGPSYSTLHAAAFRMHNRGLNLRVEVLPPVWLGRKNPLRRLSVDYTFIRQTRMDREAVYVSNYGFHALRHKLSAAADVRLAAGLTLQLRCRWQDRIGAYAAYDLDTVVTNAAGYESHPAAGLRDYRPFEVADLKLQWKSGPTVCYLEGNNLTDSRQVDIGNVPLPGRQWMSGVRVGF